MKMILTYSLILLAAAGCTARFEEYNIDRFGASSEELQRDGYSTRSSLIGLADGIIALDVNTTQFTECLLGGPMAGYLADANAGFNYTIGNFNAQNNWTKVLMEDFPKRIYPNLRQLAQVTSDPTILAVGDIIKVAGMHRIADTYGPMPYSQIGEDGALQVPFDSQEMAYKTMMEELDAAIAVLTENRTNNFTASSDVIFGGNVEKWCRYANSLKLRLAMRMSYADPAYAQQKAEEAALHEIGTMASADDIAQLTAFGNDGNPLYVAVNYNRVSTHADGTACITTGDSHAAADIILYMNGYNDPRREAYFTRCEFEGLDFAGLRHGIIIPNHASVGHRYSGIKIDRYNSPLVLMSPAESAFLKAEAVAVFGWNMGGSAKEFYEQGVRLSFEQWGVTGADAYLADASSVPGTYVDPAGTNSYNNALTTLAVAWDEGASTEQKQERIMIQKWIANFPLGNESWADIRRTGYPHILPATDAGNKSLGRVPNSGPSRMPYPQEERTSNAQNLDEAIAKYLGGEDNWTTRLWFDCKNK